MLVAFDSASFLGRLEQQDLDAYSAICRKGTVQSLLEIYRFIHRHREHAAGREVVVCDAFVSHYGKTLKLSTRDVQQQLNKFQVARTAFQSITGEPYIPGSALKGALRTAVLNHRNAGKSQPKFRGKTAGREFQEHCLEYNGRQIETDPFRLVKVGDFRAVGPVRQKIVYAVNRKKKPSDKEARRPYQILEIVEPGTEFIGTIILQKPPTRAAIKRPVTLEEIKQSLGFYSRELVREQKVLKTIGCDSGLSFHEANNIHIRLGRHSGAECVTVEGHRNIWIKQGGKNGENLDHSTTIWLASGSENPQSNKFLRPFGWAGFSILSSEETDRYRKEKKEEFQSWEQEQQEVLTVYRQQTEALGREQEEREQKAKQRAEEQRRKEEELKKYPWRAVLPTLKAVKDWGSLRTMVLEKDDFREYQQEKEIGRSVMETACRVARGNRKKWDEERDRLVADWLNPSGTDWQPMASRQAVHPQQVKSNSDLLQTIQGLQNWEKWKGLKTPISKLDLECAEALKVNFQQWGLKKSKDKQQKKAYNHLARRLNKIK